MALFALWHDDAASPAHPSAGLHARLTEAAHVVAERRRQLAIVTARGSWQLSTFATASHFYSAEAQVWCTAEQACVIHGLIWRANGERGTLLDARAIAALLDRPGATLPNDIAGEYAIARIHRCGTVELFGDPAGLHQVFRDEDGRLVAANRAAFVAILAAREEPGREAALWLTAMGYRAGEATGWAGVTQLRQGRRLTLIPDRAAGCEAASSPLLPPRRGFDPALLDHGIAQAKAAIRIATGDGPVDLPITGGKDSRVVLALALAAGLGDRLTLFTRGYPDHPDVVAGQRIAAAAGLPHRREPPLGSDMPADLDAAAFLRVLGTIAYQADGGMGGWDNIAGLHPGRDSLISGHFGELLKAYARRPVDGPLDPVAMVRLQGPFDPLDLLRETARTRLSDILHTQMDAHRAAGAREGDLPDLFYWRNRIPNWLGGIRGIKSFERQPVLPLGVPALRQLAFAMTPDERRMELAHFRIVERCAPGLLAIPFAHQTWHAALADAPRPDPLLTRAGAPLFGSWQWSINRNPAVRQALSALFGGIDIPLWDDVDRPRLLALLRERRFDYLEGISLLGLAVAALHQSGRIERRKLAPLAPVPPGHAQDAPDAPVRTHGHVDAVMVAERTADGLRMTSEAVVTVSGWAQAPDWPGASPVVEAVGDDRPIASAEASLARPDLAQAGIGNGRYGFSLSIDAASLAGAAGLTIRCRNGDALAGGRLTVEHYRAGCLEPSDVERRGDAPDAL
ncbi:hypothetical protein [uncultured Sphingomonas sp.]|uniref:hypothetical protein n=1 Tax=uncultured Sphingomonas sp. TaxID=158754 RepID=UPI0025FC4DD5|nr:hypothetical protein [uncultured Sphingomonas sp.]